MSRIKTYSIANAQDARYDIILPPDAKTVKRILATVHEYRPATVSPLAENLYPAFVSVALKTSYGIDLPLLPASEAGHFNENSIRVGLETSGTMKVLVRDNALSPDSSLVVKIIIEY